MRGRRRRINTSVMACLALLGGAGVGGLAAGFNTRAGLPAKPSSTVAATLTEMPPSETVNLRFPADWTETAGEPAQRKRPREASDREARGGASAVPATPDTSIVTVAVARTVTFSFANVTM